MNLCSGAASAYSMKRPSRRFFRRRCARGSMDRRRMTSCGRMKKELKHCDQIQTSRREWFRGAKGDDLVQLIMNSTIRRRNFFDYGFIEQLTDEHRRERQDWSAHLWALLNLSVWYDRWIL